MTAPVGTGLWTVGEELRFRQYFDNIGNMERTHALRHAGSETAAGCWLDALTEPVLRGLTELPQSVVAESLRSVKTADCCRHGGSRLGSPHARLLRALSQHRTRHRRCLQKGHHPAVICYGSHGSGDA